MESPRGHLSVLDLGLAQADVYHQVKKFTVDEEHVLVQGSDHCMVRMEVDMFLGKKGSWKEADLYRHKLQESTTYEKYTALVQEEVSKRWEEFNDSNLDRKAEIVEEIIVGNAKWCFARKVYPVKQKKELKLLKSVKRKLKELNEVRRQHVRFQIDVAAGKRAQVEGIVLEQRKLSIQQEFNDMIKKAKGNKPEEKFGNFMSNFLESQGCKIRVKFVDEVI